MKFKIKCIIRIMLGYYHKKMRTLEDFIERGEYFLDNTFMIILKKDYINKNDFVFAKIANKKNFISFFSRIFKYYKKESGNKFNGQKIIICSSQKEYKVLDFKSKKILTFYDSLERKEEILTNRKKLSKYFPSPKIIEERSCYIIEEYMEISDFNKELVLFKLFELYEKSFSKQKQKIICHGDLWSANIILKNEEVYLIDFEHVGNYSWFYDLFFYIFQESYLYNNNQLLDNYFSNKYDREFEKLGLIVNEDYNKKLCKEYFMNFFQEFYDKRWKKLSHNILYNNLEKANKILTKYDININEILNK